jgi:hypothetical protein
VPHADFAAPPHEHARRRPTRSQFGME